tara:strand:+ start:16568 stop:17566 length:999 start_codon:yes stop_codon:yes gene_type:complete
MNNKTIVIFGVVIIVVIYIVYTSVINYTATMNKEPILISGNKTGSVPLQIPAKRIQRSQDGEYGVEFTYSFWLNINSISRDRIQHIFHKGFISEPKVSTDKTQPVSIQGPGVWLATGKNKLVINMNTFDSVKETCEISNLPMNKWFHTTIVLMNRYVDIYINGRLKKRCKLNGIPKQNYNDLYINMFGGFNGFISKFRYFAHALPYFRIAQMVKDGPAASNCIATGEAVPPYLAEDYWLQPDYPDTPTPAPAPAPTPAPTPVTPVLGKCIGQEPAGAYKCSLISKEIDCCNSTNSKTCIWQNKDGTNKCSEPNKPVKKLESSLSLFKKNLFG